MQVPLDEGEDTTIYGVFRSIDNGKNWLRTSSGLPNRPVTSFTVSENIVFAGTDKGIYYSTDEGEKWNILDSTDIDAKCLLVNKKLLFAGTAHYGVWRRSIPAVFPDVVK